MTKSHPARRSSTSTPTRQMPDLLPHSTLACQVQATNAWRRDLRALLNQASERFADVCWTFVRQDEDRGEVIDGDALRPSSSVGSHADHADTIWAHKAILYARASNSFQARYLQLRTPAANLGAMASSSTVSLPIVRATSPDPIPLSQSSTPSIRSSIRRKTVRGPAPPSSYALSRAGSQAFHAHGDSEDEETGDFYVRRSRSNSSMSSSSISRPICRSGRPPSSMSNNGGFLSLPAMHDSDTLSVISSTSTVRAPMNLSDVSPAFFEATLEYLYTAEESVVDVFEFLNEDRVSPKDGVEKRLDKLRQDLVFMWRSRLYSDVDIVLGEDHVRTIPDANASVLSLALEEGTDEEESASFSAHRMMLVSRSPYFAAQLLSPYADAHSRVVRLPSPPFTPAAMHFTLGFIYTGTLFFSNRTFDLSTAFQLWLAGSYLQIETLQTLVSSLIAQDFCHSFTCSPPCKTCVKRVPRTLAFVSRPDVSDVRLRAMVQDAVSGDHFGTYWSKEVGNLDYAIRGSIVSDVCAKVDQNAGFIITTLRQLAIVGGRIDIERSTRWVDALRWMCESVQAHISGCISSKLAEIIASHEWRSLIQGVGFLNDVLEKTLAVLIDNLDEGTAACNYETLVDNVLLHEEHRPPPDVVPVVEEARKAIIQYIKKRWVNMRALASFNGLKTWALKELADEIDVPYADLVLPEEDAREASRRSARQSSVSVGLDAAPWAVSSRRTKMPAPGTLIDGEREAGPIHLRAAVLNRNAARVSATAGVRSTSATRPQTETPPQPSRLQRDSQSSSSAPGPALPAELAEPTVLNEAHNQLPAGSSTSSPLTASRGHGSYGRVSGTARFPPSSQSQRSSSTSSAPPVHEQGPARHVAATEPHKQGTTPSARPSASRFVARSNNASQQGAASTMNTSTVQLAPRGKKPSTHNLRVSSTASSSRSSVNQDNAERTRSIRSRLPSTSSVASARTVNSTASRASIIKATSKPNTTAPNEPRSGPNTRPTKATDLRKGQGVPLRKSVAEINSSRSRADLIPLDPQPTQGNRQSASVTDNAQSTRLSLGIPCVIAPTMRNGKSTRFRATVKYIGPLVSGAQPMRGPVIGVEIGLPLPAGLDEDSFDFHDGVYAGHEYWRIGTPDYASCAELHHKPESEARRQRIEEILQTGSAAYSSADESQATISPSSLNQLGDDTILPSAKRRKDLSGFGREASKESSTASRGLFIRPSEVLWVVV